MSDSLLAVVKKRTVSALVSDEIFMGILVLKGGNALDLAYDITSRGSIDIDFSIQNDFSKEEKIRMKNQATFLLNNEFQKENLVAFDVKFYDKPSIIDKSLIEFWGGYLLEFKLIENTKYEKYSDNLDKLRRESLAIGKKGSTKFTVDISKYEYVGKSKTKDLDGAIVQVYSPEMICLEKLRAICQQTEEYRKIVKSMTNRPRARDFYDIVNVTKHFNLDFRSNENIHLAKLIFDAKRVPLKFISLIPNYHDFHHGDWESVLQTLNQDFELETFDHYFNLVIELFKHLHT